MQITINIDEASGQITVEAEGQEPYQCSSTDECLEYLKSVMPQVGGGEEAAMQGEEPDMQAMWDEEAGQRKQPGLMG